MTNFEKWKHYTKHLFSPGIFLDIGWLYTVNAALERRVWIGDHDGQPLHPNLYVVLVGSPSVGKGLVLGECAKLLSFHKDEKLSSVSKEVELYTGGPNNITYEALCQRLAEGTKRRTWFNPKKNAEDLLPHASMWFILEEMESLFKEGPENRKLRVMTLELYDCKPKYEYETIKRGKDRIKFPCLSFFGGITPKSVGELFSKGILDDGWFSRALFVFENTPRFNTFQLKPPDETMLGARKDLLAHLKLLHDLTGEIRVPSHIWEFMEKHWQDVEVPKMARAYHKLDTYYGRKRVHIPKLACAFHFSESLDMELNLEDFQAAIAFLEKLEVNLVKGVRAHGRNQQNLLSKEILAFIRREEEPVGLARIVGEFSTEARMEEIQELLEVLAFTGQITLVDNKYVVRT